MRLKTLLLTQQARRPESTRPMSTNAKVSKPSYYIEKNVLPEPEFLLVAPQRSLLLSEWTVEAAFLHDPRVQLFAQYSRGNQDFAERLR